MKRSIPLGLAVVFFLLVAGLLVGLRSFSTDTNSLYADAAQNCTVSGQEFSAAYQVNAQVVSELNQQVIYNSELTFNTQLQQASENRVFGLASEISITETLANEPRTQERPIENILYLTQASRGQYWMFSGYEDLGLKEQHPMSILSQLLKNLSVGDAGKDYLFSYDPLKHHYRYQINPKKNADVSRELVSNFIAGSKQTQWQIVLDEHCVPQSMHSEEIMPMASGAQAGFIRFSINAERIPDYENLRKLAYSPSANVNNSWQVAQVDAEVLADAITTEQEMWATFVSFSKRRNTGQLVKAVDYLIDNVAAYEYAELIASGNEDDTTLRDTFFGMSLSKHPDIENYMLDVLSALPANQGETVDLQKVRLMVAVASNDQVSGNSYQSLSRLSRDASESENVRRNALISLGTTVQQMDNQDQDISALSQELSQEIVEQIDTENAYAAIFSAGNVGLEKLPDNVSQMVVEKLTSNNVKERYASATVLVRDDLNYDLLLAHLEKEVSSLVSGAIVSGLQTGKLNNAQISHLENIASTAPEQIRSQINQFLGT